MISIIDIKAKPKSSRSEIVVDDNGQIIAYLKSAPENGKANKELIKLLSQVLGIAQFDIYIVSGLTSRNKRLKIKAEKSFIDKKLREQK